MNANTGLLAIFVRQSLAATFAALLVSACSVKSSTGATGATGPAGPAGPAGDRGADGLSVTSVALPPGDSSCPFGGSGFSSVSGVSYACNGAGGAGGPQGPTGQQGPQGPTGPQGPAGASAPAAPSSGSRVVIQASRMVGTDGAQTAPSYQFYDGQLSTACSLRAAVDSTTRCLPITNSGWNGYYLDAACTQPMLLAPTSCPPAYATQSINLNASDACRTAPYMGERLFAVGGSVTPAKEPVYGYDRFAHLPDGCTVVSDTCPCLYDGTFGHDAGWSWFALGELAPASFVQFAQQ